jgi:hypothetical protein
VDGRFKAVSTSQAFSSIVKAGEGFAYVARQLTKMPRSQRSTQLFRFCLYFMATEKGLNKRSATPILRRKFSLHQ